MNFEQALESKKPGQIAKFPGPRSRPGWGASVMVLLSADDAFAEVTVDLRRAYAVVLAHPNGADLTGLDQAIHGHVRNAHGRSHLGDREQTLIQNGILFSHRSSPWPCPGPHPWKSST